MKRKRSNHETKVQGINKRPGRIGIHNVVQSWVEYPVHNMHGRQLGQIDYWCIAEYDNRKGIYIVEYKSTDTDLARKKALEQLVVGKQGVREEFNWHPDVLLYVHGDYVAERLVVRPDHGFDWKDWK